LIIPKIRLVILIIILSNIVFANNLDMQIQKAFENLSIDYVQNNPLNGVKHGVAIFPFTEKSQKAKNNKLGSTLEEIIAQSIVSSSQIFYLVERENFKHLLDEIALSQTGLLENSGIINDSNLAGANAIITGTITEIKNKFIISIRIINVSSGTVESIQKIEIVQDELIRKNEILALETISQYGLGINFQWSTAFISTDTKNFTHFTDVYLNYRPLLWLNLKMGGTVMSVNFNSDFAEASNVYPTLSNQPNPLISDLNYDGGNLTLISPYVGLEYNHMFSQNFFTSLGSSFIFGSGILTQQYSNGVFFDDDDGLVHPMKTFRIEQEIETQYIVRFESKSQYFISPRMTIGLYLAYLMGKELHVERSVVNDDYREFPHQGDPAPQEFKDKYLNMSTTLLGDGDDVEEVELSGLMVGLSFNFYF
jgi:TolB-like protein